MKLRYTTALLLGSFGIARLAIPAHALCGAVTLDEDFKGSTAVLVGRAVAQRVATTPAPSWRRATETTFEVEAVWKGVPEETVQIQTCGGIVGKDEIVCMEGFRFVVGSRYVVFADGRPLTTDACHHTALGERAQQTLQWLSKKPRKKAG
jgi:hypothetical protein